ncbi:hypothetical protein [Halococcus hamelinensis]|uniref:Uncharacterized protein n=1 Tax=Halococcus hamelinensis 100A6 TaxID=1132509 RepID=M0M8F8_9EURY|nr:hypothetical protein [Halococcus hamelinensis]EMA42001.1 hypothetical protein C447_00385 [Halococcus hamelinensis 100A6]
MIDDNEMDAEETTQENPIEEQVAKLRKKERPLTSEEKRLLMDEAIGISNRPGELREEIEYALRAGSVIHLIDGTDAEVEAIVEKAAGDRDVLTVECAPDTTSEEIPASRVPEETLVFYDGFGELPSDVQVTAAQRVKGQFEYRTPVVVRSSEEARDDLTLRNGDLVGRVRSVDLDE